MYSVQKGIMPTITGFISFVLPIWVFLLDINYIVENINTRIPEITGDSTKPLWFFIVMYFFITLLFPIFFGLLLASIFPSIELRKDGLYFRYWEFFGCKVKWGEVESLVYYSNGYIILRVDKRGLPILNGLYLNYIQARFFKSHLPIMILSPGLVRRGEIVAEILEKGSPRIVRKD